MNTYKVDVGYINLIEKRIETHPSIKARRVGDLVVFVVTCDPVLRLSVKAATLQSSHLFSLEFVA